MSGLRQATSPGDLPCHDCSAATSPWPWTADARYEQFMVYDRVWRKAGMQPDGGFLCVGCLEERLGRKLRRRDFPSVPMNSLGPEAAHMAWAQRTPRLISRLRRR